MWIDNLESVKFKLFKKMYTNCNKSVYIFVFMWYTEIIKEKIYGRKIRGRNN